MKEEIVVSIIVGLLFVAGISFIGCVDEMPENSVKQKVDMKAEKPQENTQPFIKANLESVVAGLYTEGLDFSTMNYTQTDPGEDNLWYCRNTFTGKQTKKSHSYYARVGDYPGQSHQSIFYLEIDGKVIGWDEPGEDEFLSNKR